jgi:hypothetical protein
MEDALKLYTWDLGGAFREFVLPRRRFPTCLRRPDFCPMRYRKHRVDLNYRWEEIVDANAKPILRAD